MKETEPVLEELSLEELKLLVADECGQHQAAIDYLTGLVDKAEFGLEHNFRVKIYMLGDEIAVELETKPPIGFRGVK